MPNGMQQYDYQWGDEENPTKFSLLNPGLVDLSSANPELYRGITDLRSMKAQLAGMYDPSLYGARRDEMLQREQTRLGNRMAQLGLAGSSVETGALMESGRQINMSWEDRKMSDYLRYMGAQQSLTGQINNAVLAGQNQYGAFQGQALDTIFNIQNAENQKEAAEKQFWATMLSSAMGMGGYIAGAYAGGGNHGSPTGGGAGGGGGGGGMGPGGSYAHAPTAYHSQYYGDMYGTPGSADLTMPEFGSSYNAPGYGDGYWR